LGTLLASSFSLAAEASRPAGPQLSEPKIEGERMVLSVAWPHGLPATTARLELWTADGAVRISSQWVASDAGSVSSHPMTRDLDFVADHGYRYSARLTDASGTSRVDERGVLISPCPGSQACAYRVVEGVESSAIAMSRELFELLDLLSAAGSSDLLGDALAVRPDLNFEVSWVADQIARGPDDPPGDCVCRWFAEVELDPEALEGSTLESPMNSPWPTPDWRESRFIGPGANLAVATQRLGGAAQSIALAGSGYAGLHLRCSAVAGWTPLTGSSPAAALPTLTPCEQNCSDATVTFSGWGFANVLANALSAPYASALSRSTALAELSFNGQAQFVAAAEAERVVSPGQILRDLSGESDDSGLLAAEQEILGQGATVELRAAVEIETCLILGSLEDCPGIYLRPSDDLGGWAYAQAKARTRAEIVGEASCASPPTGEVTLRTQIEDPGSKDGLLLVPWRP
ncbi:MAG: hypothetical protein AAF725_26030, partial [Acidobacteriota bacterium]